MAKVAAQRAVTALRVVKVRARQTIVDEQRHALFQLRSKAREPGLKRQADFRDIAIGQWCGQVLDGGGDRVSELGRSVELTPGEALAGRGHPERAYLLPARRSAQYESRDRHGIQHFIRQHHTANRPLWPVI